MNYSFNTTDLEAVFIIHRPAVWHINSSCSTALIHRGLTSSVLEEHCSEPKPRPLLPKGTHLPSAHTYKHTINSTWGAPAPPPPWAWRMRHCSLRIMTYPLTPTGNFRFDLVRIIFCSWRGTRVSYEREKFVKKSQSQYAHVVPVDINVI